MLIETYEIALSGVFKWRKFDVQLFSSVHSQVSVTTLKRPFCEHCCAKMLSAKSVLFLFALIQFSSWPQVDTSCPINPRSVCMRMRMAALYKLVDIGVNLGHPAFKPDLCDVIARAKQTGIVKMMITGCSEEITDQAGELASTEPDYLFYTAGVHPHDAKDFNEATTLKKLRSHLTENSQCVAVGECGLDFNRNFSPRDQQLKVFETQVQLACELQKPLFIHERDASAEMVEILSRHASRLPPAVIHCFTGTMDEARRYVDMGLHIGLTGFLWKDRTENGVKRALRERVIPLDRLLLETDAPFMYPKINDKHMSKEIATKLSIESLSLLKHADFKRNEPCSLAIVCEMIAAHMDIPAAELAEATTENAHRVYGLGGRQREN